MKSNICKIEKGARSLAEILVESERVAEYNGLTHKQSLHLRLLCEELGGMLPNIINDFDGYFWIEYNEGVCKVNVSIRIPDFDADKKNELISVAKNKKNAAAVGIVGKIRNSIENFFLTEGVSDAFYISSDTVCMASGYTECVDCSYRWSLEQYRTTVKADQKAEDWDELEKSVIASVADDVIVGIKGKQADIIIVKKFA